MLSIRPVRANHKQFHSSCELEALVERLVRAVGVEGYIVVLSSVQIRVPCSSLWQMRPVTAELLGTLV